MKAVVYQGENELSVAEVAMPRAGPHEVVLKVHDCGICGSDLHAVQFGYGMPAGTVMGHEFSGEIHEIGAGVSGFDKGDRVTSLPYIACGKCPACRRGDSMHCESIRGLGLGQMPGAYAEFVLCGAASLVRLPDRVSSEEGALVEPLSVGLHGVSRSTLDRDSPCLVMGAGPIGLSTLLWCKQRGAQTVVVSELAVGRGELALKLGASSVVNPSREDPAAKVRALCGRDPEIVFECIGVKSTLASAVQMVGLHGHVVVLGACMEPDEIVPLTCIMKEVRLDFVLGYTPAEFAETVDALAAGQIAAKPMITDVIGVDQVPAMFKALAKPGSQAKVLVEFPR